MAAIVGALAGLSLDLEAAGPRVLPVGARPADSRLGALKDLDGESPFHPPETLEAWNRRAEVVQRRIRVSQGIWPEPTRTPLNAVVHGRVEREEYTIEKVYFDIVDSASDKDAGRDANKSTINNIPSQPNRQRTNRHNIK